MRLTAKITVLIVVVLIIGFGASTIFTIKRESDLLVEQSKESARRLIATVVASIEAAMLQERPDIARMQILEMQKNTPVEGLPYCAGHTRLAYRPGSRQRVPRR